MAQLNVIQSLIKAKETLFQQIAFLTERDEVASKRLESLESKYEKLSNHLEEFTKQDEEIKEWLEKMPHHEDGPGLNEDFL